MRSSLSPRTWRRALCLFCIGLTGCTLAVGFGSAPARAATRTEKTFGSWTVVCIEDNNKSKKCSMAEPRAQVSGNQKQVVLVWSIGSEKPGAVMQSVVVPAGVSVKEGVRVFLGDADPIVLPYDTCGPKICVASAALDQKQLAAIKVSKKASASYVRGSKQLLQIDLDVAGFADAYDYFAQQMS